MCAYNGSLYKSDFTHVCVRSVWSGWSQFYGRSAREMSTTDNKNTWNWLHSKPLMKIELHRRVLFKSGENEVVLLVQEGPQRDSDLKKWLFSSWLLWARKAPNWRACVLQVLRVFFFPTKADWESKALKSLNILACKLLTGVEHLSGTLCITVHRILALIPSSSTLQNVSLSAGNLLCTLGKAPTYQLTR